VIVSHSLLNSKVVCVGLNKIKVIMSEDKIQQIRERAIETLKTYFVEDAQEILAEISELMHDLEVRGDSAKVEELHVYETLMKFIAFSMLPETEQLDLFQSSLVKAFRISIDIKNRFAIKMNLTPDVFWPETAQLFVEAILKNEEKLGGHPIVVWGENKEVPPTLSNWLRDYNRIYGVDRHEKIITHRYLTENPNVRSLKQEDQILLLKILKFYEELKFPSQKQIQEALEKALDQYAQDNGNIYDEIIGDISEGDRTFESVEDQLKLNSDDYLDSDIEDLIRKFPKVADQLISEQSIQLLFNGEWVKPVVSNWLADYRAYAGAGNHEINERSDFLMRSPNVQKLNVSERERLALLLRSYDEQYPLPFSVARQEILFERVKMPTNN